MTSWIATQSGHKIDFLAPDPDQIVLMDIAFSLSRVSRFGGHSPVKVSQHLLEVLHLMVRKAIEENLTFSLKELSEIALVALLHDFPEYVVGDCPTPLKKLLNPAFEEIETRLLNVMLVKWDLVDAYAKWSDLLKWADSEAVQQEAIRFKLDGWYLSEDLEQTQRPNQWVPQDKEINLITATVPEDMLQELLTGMFIKHMVLSGRHDKISNFWQGWLAMAAIEDKMTVEDWVKQSLSDHSLFIDHPGFL